MSASRSGKLILVPAVITLAVTLLRWWVAIGLVPQLFFWIWYTIVFGALFGIVAAAIAWRRGTAAG
jgi:hypothetical protein